MFGTRRTHSLPPARTCSISSRGRSLVSLSVTAWLWQRIAPIRTHRLSTGIGSLLRPRIRLSSAPPFHSSRLCPFPRSESIQGIRLPASAAASSRGGKSLAAHRVGHCAIDVENGAAGIVEQLRCRRVYHAHLLQELPHVCAPAPEAAW